MKPSVKYLAMYRHKDQYPISVMWTFFEVSRSGYYDYIKRINEPVKDLPLAQAINECQQYCHKHMVIIECGYGYR